MDDVDQRIRHLLDGPVGRRSFLRTGALGAGALLGGSALLAACSNSSTNTGGTGGGGGGQLVIGVDTQLNTLDNKRGEYDVLVTVIRATREALTGIGPQMQLENMLATKFVQTSPTEWDVELVPNVVYSDGTKLTVDDISKAIECYKNTPGSTFTAQQFPEWPTLTKTGTNSFTLTTKNPVPQLNYLMSNIFIIPASHNKADDVPIAPGTGPYMVKSFQPGPGIVQLVPNPHFRNTAPTVKSVEFRYIADETSRVQALNTSQVNVITTVPPDNAATISKSSKLVLQRSPGTREVHMFYNFHKGKANPAISDVRVRQALSYAIDGKTIMQNLLLGSVSPLNGVIPSTLVGANDVGSFTYNPAQAQAMLEAAGASKLPVTIIWQDGEFFSSQQVMEAIASMLGKVGVKATLKEFGAGDEILDWRKGHAGNWEIDGNGYGNQTGLGIANMLGMYAGTAQREAEGNTYQGYVYPAITALIERASSDPDAAQRQALLTQAQHEVWATWPSMWGFVQNNALAHSNNVSGIVLGQDDTFDLSQVRIAG